MLYGTCKMASIFPIGFVLIRDVPDIEFAGYPACRISGRSKSRIPDIRPDIRSFEKKNCSVSNKSLRYWQFSEDTGTGYEEIFEKCHQEYFPRKIFSLPTDLAQYPAGYRISGRIFGKAYPVSGRIQYFKKWPDIRLAGYPAHP